MPQLPNIKHERFCQAVVEGKTQDEAYAIAGYSPARSNASRMISQDNIRARIEEIRAEHAARHSVTVDRIIEEYAAAAFLDPRALVTWKKDGDVIKADIKASDEIEDKTARAISEVIVTKSGAVKFKMHDKMAALQALGRHLGMFQADNTIDVTGSIAIEDKLRRAIQRRRGDAAKG